MRSLPLRNQSVPKLQTPNSVVKMDKGAGEKKEGPVDRDIRRFYCDYCGICRSKKSLIASHILSHHKVFTPFFFFLSLILIPFGRIMNFDELGLCFWQLFCCGFTLFCLSNQNYKLGLLNFLVFLNFWCRRRWKLLTVMEMARLGKKIPLLVKNVVPLSRNLHISSSTFKVIPLRYCLLLSLGLAWLKQVEIYKRGWVQFCMLHLMPCQLTINLPWTTCDEIFRGIVLFSHELSVNRQQVLMYICISVIWIIWYESDDAFNNFWLCL